MDRKYRQALDSLREVAADLRDDEHGGLTALDVAELVGKAADTLQGAVEAVERVVKLRDQSVSDHAGHDTSAIVFADELTTAIDG